MKEDTIEGKGKQRKPKATSVVPRKTKKTISKETKKKQPGKPDKPGKPQTGFDEYIKNCDIKIRKYCKDIKSIEDLAKQRDERNIGKKEVKRITFNASDARRKKDEASDGKQESVELPLSKIDENAHRIVVVK